MDDQIEFLVLKAREVTHVALDCLQVKPLSLSNGAVLFKLTRRIVKDRYFCACCCEYWPLLPTTRGQAKHGSTE